MKKIEQINLEIERLREEKESFKKEYEASFENENLERGNLYQKYYDSFQKKDLIFAEDFPDLKILESYYSTSDMLHPIWEYGYFNIKELAEVIRLLYSFQRQKEFSILTMGYLHLESFQNLDIKDFSMQPYLHFLIGEQEQLQKYQEYQNCFIEDNFEPIKQKKRENQIVLSPMKATSDTLGIQCDCPRFLGNDKGINYRDFIIGEEIQCSVQYHGQFNIFDPFVYKKFKNYEGMNDTISFSVHKEDNFLAEILISIAIYKKNRHVYHLTNDDYRYIFQKIFGEHAVDVAKGVVKNIPKTLKYIKQ